MPKIFVSSLVKHGGDKTIKLSSLIWKISVPRGDHLRGVAINSDLVVLIVLEHGLLPTILLLEGIQLHSCVVPSVHDKFILVAGKDVDFKQRCDDLLGLLR